MPVVAPGKFSQQFYVIDPTTGQPKEVPYKIYADGEQLAKGKTDATGKTSRQIMDEVTELSVLIGPKASWRIEYPSAVETPSNPYLDNRESE
jgi:hypothetical protein